MSLNDGGRKRPSIVLDLADITNYIPSRGSWKLTPGAERPVMSSSDRRYGGAIQVGASHDNASIARTFRVRGSSANTALQNYENLIKATQDYAGKFLEWRPDGATRSTFFELRGTAGPAVNYDWAQFA